MADRFVSAGALDVDRRPTGMVPRRLPNWTRPATPLFMEIMVHAVGCAAGVRVDEPHDRTRRAADAHRNIEARPAAADSICHRRQRRQKRRDRMRRPVEDRSRRSRQSNTGARRSRHGRVRRSTGRTQAMRTLVAGQRDPRSAELAHRRRRDRSRHRASGRGAVGASRQLDQPLYGSVEPDRTWPAVADRSPTSNC